MVSLLSTIDHGLWTTKPLDHRLWTPKPPNYFTMNQTNNNEEQHNVNHRPETLARIRQIQEWLINGMSQHNIVQDGMRLWNLQKTVLYDYIEEALKGFSETANTERKEDRQLQIQVLMQLYNETM